MASYVARIEVDAWVIVSGSRGILEWFARQQIPAFALFGVRQGVPIAATGPDKVPTLIELTRRLVALGHRRISFIVRQEHRNPEPSLPVRAYLETLEEAGITTGKFNLPDWEESREGFKRLLDSLFGGPTPPKALILDEAFQFNASYHHLSQRGLKIPGDVSLVCTDDDPGFDWCAPRIPHPLGPQSSGSPHRALDEQRGPRQGGPPPKPHQGRVRRRRNDRASGGRSRTGLVPPQEPKRVGWPQLVIEQ